MESNEKLNALENAVSNMKQVAYATFAIRVLDWYWVARLKTFSGKMDRLVSFRKQRRFERLLRAIRESRIQNSEALESIDTLVEEEFYPGSVADLAWHLELILSDLEERGKLSESRQNIPFWVRELIRSLCREMNRSQEDVVDVLLHSV